ncbi:MAG: polyprenyl synthetase family protein [Burkholderiales bacterium]|nr:polyprenyl synthetase family protein [Burkholderiales bacterium]
METGRIEHRIEQALQGALALAEADGAPPRLAAAMRHAVFPGGARIRPKLVLSVALACGDGDPPLADAAAAAIELLHCASLVHDDLPCFDAALLRRGVETVHVAYGERLAVLAGDALIVLAFQSLAAAATASPRRLPALMGIVARSVGMPLGIVAGQAWECEPRVSLAEYQRAKTGSLFAAATESGAEAAGRPGAPWRNFGQWLGEAYQVADDIRDVASDPAALGKPVGQDQALCRPSAAADLGLQGAMAHCRGLLARAMAAIPDGRGAPALRALVRAEADRLLPSAITAEIARLAA